MDPRWKQINEAIHRRDLETVRELVPKYLRARGWSAEARYEASEFLRKISDYAGALRVLPKERGASPTAKISEIETKLELQLARILNILGASNYSLRVIKLIRSEGRAKSKVEMAEIYHCNCRFEQVVKLLGEEFPQLESEPWHQDWLLHFYYAYALSRIGRQERAIKRLEKIYSLSKSPLIQAIALSYQGQIFTENGSPAKGLRLFTKARTFFRESDATSDHAILQKWLGICLLQLGDLKGAKVALERAFHILYQPSVRPEDWMEIVLWLDRIPSGETKGERFAPRLRAMEGPTYSPLTETGERELGGNKDIFSISHYERKRKLRHFDRASDIAWERGIPRLGLDLVDELICNLIYAGKYGLPQFKLYELLWPTELFSFAQHEKRLERLVSRARARGYQIHWKDLHLWLKSINVTSSGRPEKVVRGRAFLETHALFTRDDVQKYFHLSRAGAILLCRHWRESALITPTYSSSYKSALL